MTTDSMSSAGAPRSRVGRRPWLPWVVALVAGLVLLTAFLMASAGARLDASTTGLVVAAVGLVFCLHTLYRVVQALSRPSLALAVEREEDLTAAGRRELQEERRRLLRAIRELEFDHQMGKLSESDYKEVRAAYELRAIEVMRALEAEPSLASDLVAELRARGVAVGDSDGGGEAASAEASARSEEKPDDPGPSTPDVSKTAEVGRRGCASCGGENDEDAKFCKHCGKELAA